MKIRTSCLLLSACLLAGCWQKSLNPFYTAADLAFDSKLAGSWKEKKESSDGKEEKGQDWTFTAGPDKGYKLEIEDGDETHRYDAHLFKLDGHRLLDIVPTERTVSTIPAHNLFRVIEIGPTLQLAALNPDWVHKWLRKNPGALAHVAVVDPEHRDDREKDELVLTAETKALQKFLREHWSDADLFTGPVVFKAVPNGAIEKASK